MKTIEDNAVDESTRHKDANRVKDYLRFCKNIGIRNKDAIPAHPDLVAAWVSSFAGRFCSKTVGAKICAIKKLHNRLGYHWNYDDRLQQMVKGIEQLRPLSSIHAKRAPVTMPMLLDINNCLDRTNGLDICICCVILLCFFCQLQAGKILCPTHDINKFDPSLIATFDNITESMAKNGACNLHLPWSKMEKAQGDDVWIPCQEAPLMHHHLKWKCDDISSMASMGDSREAEIQLYHGEDDHSY
jgi:hypothetical protein